jgi:hypothetical protein
MLLKWNQKLCEHADIRHSIFSHISESWDLLSLKEETKYKWTHQKIYIYTIMKKNNIVDCLKQN